MKKTIERRPLPRRRIAPAHLRTVVGGVSAGNYDMLEETLTFHVECINVDSRNGSSAVKE